MCRDKGPSHSCGRGGSVSSNTLWNALQDLGVLTAAEPAFVVVKDRRNPGAYTLWRPDRHANAVDFRRLQGSEVVFKHATGLLAVVKTPPDKPQPSFKAHFSFLLKGKN
jgi:hypothetical protein